MSGDKRVTLFLEHDTADNAEGMAEFVQGLVDEALGPDHIEVTHLPPKERL